jgi:DNA-binding transcriptional MerR regulator
MRSTAQRVERGKYLRPIDLARAVGVSPQTVRNYERWGVLPRAERSPSGARRFDERHLAAMQAVRRMVVGYSPKTARRIMRLLQQGNLRAALTTGNGCHAALHQQLLAVERALGMLRTISRSGSTDQGEGGCVQVGEAARRVGVPVTTLHFWEQQGLIQPHRDKTSRYRLYDPGQCQQLQVIAALRQASYSAATICAVVERWSAGATDQAGAIAERRLDEVQSAIHRCIEATAALWVYLQQADLPSSVPLHERSLPCRNRLR